MNGYLTQFRAIYENWYEPEYAGASADLYWRSLLALAALLVIATGCYGANLYFSVLSDISNMDGQAARSAPPPELDQERAQLDSAISEYAARQTRFQALRAGPIESMTDPGQ